MSGVKIKDIPGVLVERRSEVIYKSVEGAVINDRPVFLPENKSYNQAIEEQGEVEITLNRERLARICHKNSGYGRGFGRKFDLMCASDQEVFYNEADAILSDLPGLLEAKDV